MRVNTEWMEECQSRLDGRFRRLAVYAIRWLDGWMEGGGRRIRQIVVEPRDVREVR